MERHGGRSTLLVAGNGMVGHKLIETLRERDVTDAWDIIVFGLKVKRAISDSERNLSASQRPSGSVILVTSSSGEVAHRDADIGIFRRAMIGVALITMAWAALGAWAPATWGTQTTADEPQYLMTAISLGQDGNLNVADERTEKRYVEFHDVGLPLQEKIRPDGKRISPHDPLMPAILAIPVAMGGWLGAKLALAAMAGALSAAILWVAVRRLHVSVLTASLTVLSFALAPPLSIYATQVYPELPAALAVVIALGALLGSPRRWGALVLGVAVVALPWLSVKYAPVALALVLCAIWRWWERGSRREVVLLSVTLAVATALYFIAHFEWYGGWTVYASGSHFSAGEYTVMGRHVVPLDRSVRLIGLLMDRDFGLFPWNPAFLLSVPALVAIAKRRAFGGGTLILTVMSGWLVATFMALTMHGWWWPGRQVVVILPAVVLSVASWVGESHLRRKILGVLGALGAINFIWLLADVAADRTRIVIGFASTTSPVFSSLNQLLPDYRNMTSAMWAIHGVWLVILGALAVWSWHNEVNGTDKPRGIKN